MKSISDLIWNPEEEINAPPVDDGGVSMCCNSSGGDCGFSWLPAMEPYLPVSEYCDTSTRPVM